MLLQTSSPLPTPHLPVAGIALVAAAALALWFLVAGLSRGASRRSRGRAAGAYQGDGGGGGGGGYGGGAGRAGRGAAADLVGMLGHHQQAARAIERHLYSLRARPEVDGWLVAELRRLEGIAAQLRSDIDYSIQLARQLDDEVG